MTESATPISDAALGSIAEMYSVAQELERKVVGLEAAARFWQDKCGNECEARNAIQAKLDTLMLEFCPQEVTAEQRDKWEQSQKPICPACNGNDHDMPCAYPSEGKMGCLRDKRLHTEVFNIPDFLRNPRNLKDERKAEVESLRARNELLESSMHTNIINRGKDMDNLRARNDKLYADYKHERMLRYAAEAEVKAETKRCAQVARDFAFSPANGRAIAALIMEGR